MSQFRKQGLLSLKYQIWKIRKIIIRQIIWYEKLLKNKNAVPHFLYIVLQEESSISNFVSMNKWEIKLNEILQSHMEASHLVTFRKIQKG